MATKAIPVVAAKVAATLADYPAYVKPSAMTGWGTVTLAEAQSFRFYSDAGLTTELAREIVSADEQHVKIPSLSTTTEIWCSYNGTDSDYAVDATYGAEAVWGDYRMVLHNGGTLNSTGISNGTANGGVSIGGATGKLGEATTYDGTNDWVSFADNDSYSLNGGSDIAHTFQAWTTDDWLIGKGNSGNTTREYVIWDRPSLPNLSSFLYDGSFGNRVRRSKTTGLSVNAWDMFHHVYTGTPSTTALTIAQNGVFYSIYDTSERTAGYSSMPNSANPVSLMRLFHDDAFYEAGTICEVRIRASALPANWITTEYNNQSDVASFWGTVTDAGSAPVAKKGFMAWL